MAEQMYVTKSKSCYLLELRQVRYKATYQAGKEHPHDLCAIAHDVAEMHSMIDKHWPDADYSEVEEA